MPDSARALAYHAEHARRYRDDLESLIRIPSVSSRAHPAGELRRSAEAVAALLAERGLERVDVLEVPGAHPYVYGERLRDPSAPTILLYAHHDVQPAGDEEAWTSPPFEPAERGGRLYGRGAADDKAGVVVHAAAVESWVRGGGELPLNVRVLIEGEEEIGSPHLRDFLRRHRSRLDADVLVLMDTGNVDTGLPCLTVALRGLVTMEVEVRALERALHSGIWGGPVPDPALALAAMLSALVRPDGSVSFLGGVEPARSLTEIERSGLARLPEARELFRSKAGMLQGVQLLGAGHPCATSWYRPSLTVDALQASTRDGARSVINSGAWARLGMRLVHGMSPSDIAVQLATALRRAAPWGVQVDLEVVELIAPWATDTTHPAFAAAWRALEKGYGREALAIGCGGSIGFVEAFAHELGGAPVLLIGVEDPRSNAHAEDESVDLADFEKATRSAIHLYAELANALRT